MNMKTPIKLPLDPQRSQNLAKSIIPKEEELKEVDQRLTTARKEFDEALKAVTGSGYFQKLRQARDELHRAGERKYGPDKYGKFLWSPIMNFIGSERAYSSMNGQGEKWASHHMRNGWPSTQDDWAAMIVEVKSDLNEWVEQFNRTIADDITPKLIQQYGADASEGHLEPQDKKTVEAYHLLREAAEAMNTDTSLTRLSTAGDEWNRLALRQESLKMEITQGEKTIEQRVKSHMAKPGSEIHTDLATRLTQARNAPALPADRARR